MALQDQLVEQLRGWITAIKLETAYSPPIIIRDPFAPGAPSPLLSALKPRITIEVAGGSAKPILIAPYGAPEPSRWPALKLAAAAAAVLAIVLGLRALR